MTAKIDKSKFNIIRKRYIESSGFNQRALSRELSICRTTMRKYRAECEQIALSYPNRLRDFKFRLPTAKKIAVKSPMYYQLIDALPRLVDQTKQHRVFVEHLWQDYRQVYPSGYGFHWFCVHYLEWRQHNNICCYAHRRVRYIPPEDRVLLMRWANSNDHKQWERANTILGSFAGKTVKHMAVSFKRSVKCILRWVDNYKEKGIEGLIDAPYTVSPVRLDDVQRKQDNLVKLLHQTPQIHGLNRASWKLQDLADIYVKIYSEPMSHSTVHTLLKKAGYGFRKSRERLTSPDPDFREKLDNIKNILRNIGDTEKFFSVDEYGHFSVNVRGGRSYAKSGEQFVVDKAQKSRGWLIVTAALELSTNQITHFYSRYKNTDEMIKLLEVLLSQYKDSTKLYFSWDAAAWHASKKLYKKIEEINSLDYRNLHHTPEVHLAPLPSSAQFLNVIESVFSGLAKAVIHNSNYNTVDDCRAAIDRHFSERNTFFLKNPKRAGNIIWGKEEVKPVFSDVNSCKKPPCKVTPIKPSVDRP